jgi:hypothetical protein
MEISHTEIIIAHRPLLKVSLMLVKIMKFHKNLSGRSRYHPCGQTAWSLFSQLFSESALEKAYRTKSVNCQHQRFEPITMQTVRMSASNQLWRKLMVSALLTNYDSNCQHQRFEPIMTQTVRMSASNQLRRKLSAWALRTNYNANWRYRRFEPIMTKTDSIGSSNQLPQTSLTLNTYHTFDSEQKIS